LYYAALEHRDRIGQEVVMPSVGWKTDEVKKRINKASAEASKI